MIDAVSNVSFRGETANVQDLINSPGQFSAPASIPETPVDSFEKEEKTSKTGLKAFVATALVALAAFVGLGYAVKKGHLAKVDIAEDAKFMDKAIGKLKNAGAYIGEKAVKCYETVAGWLGKKGEKAVEQVTESK